jgi:hypothetical protein
MPTLAPIVDLADPAAAAATVSTLNERLAASTRATPSSSCAPR